MIRSRFTLLISDIMILCEFDLYCYALVLCGLYRNNKTKHCAFDLKSVMKSKQIFYLHLLGSGLVIVVHTRQYTERQWITALICEPVAINCLVNFDFDNIIEWWRAFGLSAQNTVFSVQGSNVKNICVVHQFKMLLFKNYYWKSMFEQYVLKYGRRWF